MIDKKKEIIKCPYKEPPVPIMDMHVHISDSSALIIYYTRCVEQPFFRGILETEIKKKMYLKVLQGRWDTVNKFRTCTLEGEGVTFCCDSSKTHAKHLSYNKIL